MNTERRIVQRAGFNVQFKVQRAACYMQRALVQRARAWCSSRAIEPFLAVDRLGIFESTACAPCTLHWHGEPRTLHVAR